MAQTYQCVPSEAWAEIGRPPLSPRQRRRLAFAINDLVSIDRAMESVGRKRSGKDAPPTAEEMLTAHEAQTIYNEREQPTWDAIAAEIERETGERVVPFTGDVLIGDMIGASLPDVFGVIDDADDEVIGV